MVKKLSDRLVDAMPRLDGIASGLSRIVAPIVGESAPRSLKDALVGVWLGHPLHPAIVVLPIGCWTSAFALDLVGEDDASDLLIGLGLASSAAAMATGAAQWYDATNDTRPRRLGALHASVNTVAAALYGASLVARRNGNRGAGVALSSVGYAVVTLGGMLGGDLAYDLGIGVDHAAFEPPVGKWKDVLDDEALLPGKPVRVSVNGTAVMLLRHEDGIHAIGATCPHLGGPLDEGKIEGETVTCPWHGSVFRLTDGCLLHGPATAPVVQYETRIRAGKIGVRSLDNRTP
jgi:nitrite reductase/ring-hydroxylating ferredoxin subunit/uncharacterized membrane protein